MILNFETYIASVGLAPDVWSICHINFLSIFQHRKWKFYDSRSSLNFRLTRTGNAWALSSKKQRARARNWSTFSPKEPSRRFYRYRFKARLKRLGQRSTLSHRKGFELWSSRIKQSPKKSLTNSQQVWPLQSSPLSIASGSYTSLIWSRLLLSLAFCKLMLKDPSLKNNTSFTLFQPLSVIRLYILSGPVFDNLLRN